MKKRHAYGIEGGLEPTEQFEYTIIERKEKRQKARSGIFTTICVYQCCLNGDLDLLYR